MSTNTTTYNMLRPITNLTILKLKLLGKTMEISAKSIGSELAELKQFISSLEKWVLKTQMDKVETTYRKFKKKSQPQSPLNSNSVNIDNHNQLKKIVTLI